MDLGSLRNRLDLLLATCQKANAAPDPRPMLGLVTREVAALAALVAPEPIVGENPKIQSVRRTIENIRASSASVLITGETGTGKKLVAATIHHTSLRSHGPFVRLRDAGAAASLAELFRRARGGTLYLDEVSELDQAAQGEILRALDDTEVDVRFLAASGRDLETEAARGALRRDLYYRLKVIHIALPALREMAEDIPALVESFLSLFAAESQRPPVRLPAESIEALRHRAWPGNIGQLRAEVRRLAGGGTLNGAVRKLEKEMLAAALTAAHQNQCQAARMLGLSRQGLINKMKRYGLGKP